MAVTLRPITPADVPDAGRICHDAFAAIAGGHNFPPDFPDRDVATEVISRLVGHAGFYGVVAEEGGRVLGSNFVDERSPIVGLGPITVDPAAQNKGVGAALMRHMIERADRNRAPGLRLLQSGYHTRSLCLYTKLGFAPREPIANLQGRPLGITVPGCTVRPARVGDAESCDRLCRAVHGHDRGGELRDAIADGVASLVERDGRITGYTTSIAFFGHAVGESDDDLKALIGAAPAFGGPGFLL
ncbi:MAG TPA: GNAT family N-acetyltransferase, partial [Stellaceae bacterium]|nr:GNAT family N-acetyltransferase [Stellaceae bacterium]